MQNQQVVVARILCLPRVLLHHLMNVCWRVPLFSLGLSRRTANKQLEQNRRKVVSPLASQRVAGALLNFVRNLVVLQLQNGPRAYLDLDQLVQLRGI